MDLPHHLMARNGEMPVVSELDGVPETLACQLSVQSAFITYQVFRKICSSSNILLPRPH